MAGIRGQLSNFCSLQHWIIFAGKFPNRHRCNNLTYNCRWLQLSAALTLPSIIPRHLTLDFVDLPNSIAQRQMVFQEWREV